MKPILKLSSIVLQICFLLQFSYSQFAVQPNQISIRNDGVFVLNGQPFFPIMLSHELGASNFNSELKRSDGKLYGFNVINLHKQVNFMYNCYFNNGENCRNTISGDLTSGGHYTDILGNMNWQETWQGNANRIFNYLQNMTPDQTQNVYVLSDDYAFMTSTNSHFVQNCGSGSCEDFVVLDPITQTDRNNAIDRINQLAYQQNSKLIGFFSMDDANMMGTYLDGYPCSQQNGSYFSNYYFNNINQQVQELTNTYNYAKSVYPTSIVYMAAPPVFYPAALDINYWNNHSLSEIRSLWKNTAHNLAGATDVMYAMFFNFETWGANWRLYDGPGYPSWYLEHLNVMKNEILSGFDNNKAMLGGYWMDGENFLPQNDNNMPRKLKWATYVSLLKGATGLNFFGWHYKDYLRPYWDQTRYLVDTLANEKNLDELVFTKTNSGSIGHTLSGNNSQNISYAVYKTNNNNWNDYYLLVTNNPNGSLNGNAESNNMITITSNVTNYCYYNIKEVFSNNTVTPAGNHQFSYEFPWFGTALFHFTLKSPAPKNCVEERPQLNENNVPGEFYIEQNYPNPFNPETEITFGLPDNEFVSIVVYNTLGQQVKQLVNEQKNAGVHKVKFNAENLPSGAYIYKITAGNYTATKKMLLVK